VNSFSGILQPSRDSLTGVSRASRPVSTDLRARVATTGLEIEAA